MTLLKFGKVIRDAWLIVVAQPLISLRCRLTSACTWRPFRFEERRSCLN